MRRFFADRDELETACWAIPSVGGPKGYNSGRIPCLLYLSKGLKSKHIHVHAKQVTQRHEDGPEQSQICAIRASLTIHMQYWPDT